MSRDDTAEDFTALHDRRVMDADGAPGLRGRFVAYLDRGLSAVAAEEAAPAEEDVQELTLDEACARLAVEYPVWWEAVDLCCRQGLTERDAAPRLGVSPALVHRRKAQGLAHLAVWCAAAADDMALLLRQPLSLRVLRKV